MMLKIQIYLQVNWSNKKRFKTITACKFASEIKHTYDK